MIDSREKELCEEEDSNLHGSYPASTSIVRVSQNNRGLSGFRGSEEVRTCQKVSDFGGSPPIDLTSPLASIATSCGRKVLVDQDVLGWASKLRWAMAANRYAARKGRSEGRAVTVYLHRLIVGAGPLDVVDHIDCLGTTKSGAPRHPLYVRAVVQHERFELPRRAV